MRRFFSNQQSVTFSWMLITKNLRIIWQLSSDKLCYSKLCLTSYIIKPITPIFVYLWLCVGILLVSLPWPPLHWLKPWKNKVDLEVRWIILKHYISSTRSLDEREYLIQKMNLSLVDKGFRPSIVFRETLCFETVQNKSGIGVAGNVGTHRVLKIRVARKPRDNSRRRSNVGSLKWEE